MPDWYLRFVEIEVELLWAVDILAAIYVMEFFEFYDIMELREIFVWSSGTHIIQILKKSKE